jgi:hypothetical protein
VPFHRKLAERRFQLGIVRVPFNFQGFVIAALGGHQSDPPEIPKLTHCASEASFAEGTRIEGCSLQLNEK